MFQKNKYRLLRVVALSMALFFQLSVSLKANAAEVSLTELKNFQQLLLFGTKKQDSSQLKNNSILEYYNSIEANQKLSEQPKNITTPECNRYFQALRKIRVNITDTLQNLSKNNFKDDNGIFQSHLDTLFGSFSLLIGLAQSGAEGGIDFVTGNAVNCSSSNRTLWLETLNVEYNSFRQTLKVISGTRGLTSVYELGTKMRSYAAQNADTAYQWFLPKLIGGTAVSIVLWELTMMRLAWLVKAGIVGTRTVTVLKYVPAIGFGAYLGAKSVSEKLNSRPLAIGQWEDSMSGVEEVMDWKIDTLDKHLAYVELQEREWYNGLMAQLQELKQRMDRLSTQNQ